MFRKVGRLLEQHYVVAVPAMGEGGGGYLDANGFVCGIFDAVYFDSENEAIAHKNNAKQYDPKTLGTLPLINVVELPKGDHD